MKKSNAAPPVRNKEIKAPQVIEKYGSRAQGETAVPFLPVPWFSGPFGIP